MLIIILSQNWVIKFFINSSLRKSDCYDGLSVFPKGSCVRSSVHSVPLLRGVGPLRSGHTGRSLGHCRGIKVVLMGPWVGLLRKCCYK
jgi:hypothetical protein